MITKSQQMMVDDGLPASLIMSQEERRLAWKGVKVREARFVDPAMERQERLKEEARRLRAEEERRRDGEAKSKRASASPAVSHDGETWNTKYSRWDKIPGWKPEAKKKEKLASKKAVDAECFKVREGTHKAALLAVLIRNMGTPRSAESLAEEVYGEAGRVSALAGVIKGVEVAISSNRLAFDLEKSEAGYELVRR